MHGGPVLVPLSPLYTICIKKNEEELWIASKAFKLYTYFLCANKVIFLKFLISITIFFFEQISITILQKDFESCLLQKDFESCLLQKDRSILVCPNVTEPTNPIKRCSL